MYFLSTALLLTAQQELPALKTTVTVTESISADVPAHMTVLGAPELQRTPGVNADDRLRTIPGFSLFRRSSSLVAHPSTQGVSLRGLGSTAASRTLVRWDGIPLNEPFGAWVQWSRVAPEALERVEVTRGASTSLFGDHSMGGTISLFSKPPERSRLDGSYEGGNRGTHSARVGASRQWNRWAATGHLRGVTTGGYFIVPEAERGPVDRPADVRFLAGDVRLDGFRGNHRLFLKLDALAEERSNGSLLRGNSTSLGAISAHYARDTARDSVSLTAYHVRGAFRDRTSSISLDRKSETAATRQRVPSESAGGSGLWRRDHRRWNSILGADWLRVEGYSHQTTVPTGASQTAGGTLFQHGYFWQSELRWRSSRLFAGARYQTAGSGRRFFSPSAGVTISKGPIRLRGSAYRAFRIPTLDELYRQFRVGNTVTLPNASLRPETMAGGEAGIDLLLERTRISITLYRNSLDQLITNVTVSATPTLIQRQKQNAGTAAARGVEIEARRQWRGLAGELSYLFVESRFENGARLPQVAKHQGSAILTYSRGRTLVSAGLRACSSQFEDDLNTLLMPGYAVLHLMTERRLSGSLSGLFAMENALNRVYVVAFTPTAGTGAPRLWRLGLRWRG